MTDLQLQQDRTFIKNAIKHSASKSYGMSVFYSVFDNLSVQYIDMVYQVGKVNFMAKEHYSKFDTESKKDKYIEYLEYFLSKLDNDNNIFSKKYALKVQEDSYNQKIESFIKFFDVNEKTINIVELYLTSVFHVIDSLMSENDIKENTQRKITAMVSAFYQLVNNLPNVVSDSIFKLFESRIKSFCEKEPLITLTLSLFSLNLFNEKHKEILELLNDENYEYKDSPFLKFKNITANKLSILNKDLLVNNPNFSKLIGLRVRDRNLFKKLPEDIKSVYKINYDTKVFSAKLDIAKNKNSFQRYAELNFFFLRFEADTIVRVLRKIDVVSLSNQKSFVMDSLNLCDNFGYLTDEQIEELELIYAI